MLVLRTELKWGSAAAMSAPYLPPFFQEELSEIVISTSQCKTVCQASLLHVVHDFSADNGCHDPASELPAIERSVARKRAGTCAVKCPLLFRIEDRHIGSAA